jgi:hypothetical protein
MAFFNVFLLLMDYDKRLIPSYINKGYLTSREAFNCFNIYVKNIRIMYFLKIFVIP